MNMPLLEELGRLSISPVTLPSNIGLSPGCSAFACLSVSAISAHRIAHRRVADSARILAPVVVVKWRESITRLEFCGLARKFAE